MVAGLTRRQRRRRRTDIQKMDIESGLKGEEDSSDDDSRSGKAYSNSRCGRIMTSCMRKPILQGEALKFERRCCSTIPKSQGKIRKQTICTSTLTSLSLYFTFFRRYLETTEEGRAITPGSERIETKVEVSERSISPLPVLDVRNEPVSQINDVKLSPPPPAQSPELSFVHEEAIVLSRMVNKISEAIEKRIKTVSIPDASFGTADSLGYVGDINNSALVIEDDTCDESGKFAKLVDYSKYSVHQLPEISTSAHARISFDVAKEEHIQELNDSDEEWFDRDTGDYILELNDNARVRFFLRVPAKSKFRNRRMEGTQDNLSLTLSGRVYSGLGNGSNHSTNRRKNKTTRRASMGSEVRDLSPHRGFVAPFPTPLSRESSDHNLDTNSNSSSHKSESFHTPAESSSHLDRLGQCSADEEQHRGSAQGRGSFVAGSKIERYDGNCSRKQSHRTSNNSAKSFEHGEYKSLPFYLNDRHNSNSSDEEYMKRSHRTQRRNSFVAGSRIERFDGSKGRSITAVNDNLKTNSSDEVQRRSSFVDGSGIERFDGSGSRNTAGVNYNLKYSSSDEEFMRKPLRTQRRNSFVAGSRIERFDGSGGSYRRRLSSGTDLSTEFVEYKSSYRVNADEERRLGR